MLVKDLDRFDMIFQAWEYEKGIYTKIRYKSQFIHIHLM